MRTSVFLFMVPTGASLGINILLGTLGSIDGETLLSFLKSQVIIIFSIP